MNKEKVELQHARSKSAEQWGHELLNITQERATTRAFDSSKFKINSGNIDVPPTPPEREWSEGGGASYSKRGVWIPVIGMVLVYGIAWSFCTPYLGGLEPVVIRGLMYSSAILWAALTACLLHRNKK